MDYTAWRNDIFGQPADAEVVSCELLQETYHVPPDENMEHVDRMLSDPEIHQLYTREQIGIGLNLIYCSYWSGICECYSASTNLDRRLAGIRNLRKLYENFFDRYCTTPVENIGNQIGSQLDYLCYMLWDTYPLWYDCSEDEAMALLEVLRGAIKMRNDNCIASGIHGLGHWANDEPRAVEVLQDWLRNPTTENPHVIEYAQDATTGSIQ